MTASIVPLALLATSYAATASIEGLATSLEIPVVTDPRSAMLLLRHTPDGLELYKPGDSALPGALKVDFTSPGTCRRVANPGQELLVRATRVRRTVQPLLIDATAGLGNDGFLLAAAGYRVQMFEMNPVVAALLADGLNRARRTPTIAAIAERIRLTACDARTALSNLDEHPEVIYLDPMFPARSKSALVKQELRLLQLLDPHTLDPGQLLRAALAVQARKVVVKRPRTGACLLDMPPAYAVRGKAIRFDVYVGSGKKSMSP